MNQIMFSGRESLPKPSLRSRGKPLTHLLRGPSDHRALFIRHDRPLDQNRIPMEDFEPFMRRTLAGFIPQVAALLRAALGKGGPEFGNLVFRNAAERAFVKNRVQEVSNHLRELRKSKSITQEKMAEMIGASVATIKFIEQGQRSPSLAMVFKILYALDRDAKLM